MNQRLYDPLMHAFVASVTVTHRILHHLSGGRLGKRFPGGGYAVWLTVTGRKSGQPRTVPLLGVPESDAPGAPWLVAGSNGGQTKPPAWIHNARANPEGGLEVNGERFPIRIEEVTDEAEHERLYATLTRAWKGYRFYAQQTSRRIPVFRLHRLDATEP